MNSVEISGRKKLTSLWKWEKMWKEDVEERIKVKIQRNLVI